MNAEIKRIRKSLTTIELEAGTKHPDKPDWEVMIREAEEAEFHLKRVIRDLKELRGFSL